MKDFLLIFAITQFMISCNGQENRNTFSQTINENEKHLSAILDTLDNEYYWQQIPEDLMGRTPPNGYWKKYPFRVKLYELLDDIKVTLAKPMSAEYLLTLYDTKHTRKIGEHYKTIAEKLISFHSDSTNLKLWNIAIAKYETDREYLYDNLREYVIWEFVRNKILEDKTRAYIVLNKDFKTQYFGHFEISVIGIKPNIIIKK